MISADDFKSNQVKELLGEILSKMDGISADQEHLAVSYLVSTIAALVSYTDYAELALKIVKAYTSVFVLEKKEGKNDGQ